MFLQTWGNNLVINSTNKTEQEEMIMSLSSQLLKKSSK
jgi:hypothetical protein